ncbi:MAG: GGDEF domain-containing protein, partial [Halofilum sp. (in: g-proteobacteria)]|nr:GGDEF domain-containing protein [Halofilum sp. (in: g-proteobacteria)]
MEDVHTAAEVAAVRHLFDQFGTAVAVNLLLATLVVTALLGHVGQTLVFGWLGLIVTVTVLRMALHSAYHHDEREAGSWGWYFLVLAALSGLCWGVAVPLFVPQVPPQQALVLMVAIAGIVAGAIGVQGSVPRVYITYLVATLSPPVITFFYLGDRASVLLGVMTLLFGLAMALAGVNFGRNLRHAHYLSAKLNEANRELERQASRDALTGLWNRSRFETALDDEFDRVARYGTPCTLIMLDIDRFKQVNDNYGHDVGDRVLMQLGELLRAEIRNPDCVARWGGEEFMVLLPETNLAAGAWAAERLRRRVAEHSFDGPGRITVSLGVAEYAGGEERLQLLKRLDDALYRAKQDGRDRVD